MSTINQRPSIGGSISGTTEMEGQLSGATTTGKFTIAQLAAVVAGIIGGGDTTAPTITARNVLDSDTVRIDYNENVNASTAGHSIIVNGTPFTPTGAVAVDGNTVDYTIAGTIAAGDTVTHSYSLQGTGAGTRDTAGNQLAGFTGQSVTNGLSGGSGYEPESDTYFAANTGLTTPEKDAVDAFIVSLKSIGWTKFKAVYLPIWGSAADNKWNLVDPEDNDASYRLTFSGTVTHGTNFIKGDGSTGFANTHLNPTTDLPSMNYGVSMFVKQFNFSSGKCAIGSCNDGESEFLGIFPDIATLSYGATPTKNMTNALPTLPDDFFMSVNRQANNDAVFYVNGEAGVADTTTESTDPQNVPIYLLAANAPSGPKRFMTANASGENEFQFFMIHEGLTSSEYNTIRVAWNTFKSAMGI